MERLWRLKRQPRDQRDATPYRKLDDSVFRLINRKYCVPLPSGGAGYRARTLSLRDSHNFGHAARRKLRNSRSLLGRHRQTDLSSKSPLLGLREIVH